MEKLLSVLICTITERVLDGNYLPRLIKQLTRQVLPEYKDKVEILVFNDNRTYRIGEKRNLLIKESKGKFVCFVDDDDLVSEDYISTLVEVIESNPDVEYIGWKQQFVENGIFDKRITLHSLKYHDWFEDDVAYYRNVTHLNPILREKAVIVLYEPINVDEDNQWSQKVYKILHSEYFIDKIMYYYYFNSETSLSWDRFEKNSKNYTRSSESVEEVFESLKQDFITFSNR